MAIHVNVAQAKAYLAELLVAVDAGEEVIIDRGGFPAVRLAAVTQPIVRLGILEGLVDPKSVPNFFESMSAKELAEWEG